MMEVNDKFREALASVRGLLHVGANNGREAPIYQSFDLDVLWVEPLPTIYRELLETIKDLDKQKAINALITDEDGKKYNFNVASNNGASSSIFTFAEHQAIWPEVTFTHSMLISGITLSTLYEQGQIEKGKYQALVIDVQGSEYLVLQGAGKWLTEFEFIHLEVADFNSYEGGCRLGDIESFMRRNNYVEIERECFAQTDDGRQYFNILYSKKPSFEKAKNFGIPKSDKLHLGCGKRFLEGYVHIDIIDYDHVDHVSDVSDLNFLKDATFREIYASHILEHIRRPDLERVLTEWNRLLKPGGILRLAVPDFDSILEYVSQYGPSSLANMQGLLYGGQTHEYNFHHSCFNFETLKTTLESSSFQNIQRYDWRSFLPEGFDDYSRAYMPHKDFLNGKLMSLNVVAEKV